ncbi:Asp23/Gls24 family envelope stress response protein [Streptomyces sp. PSKA30]|uniref:Asp23/Gls24 family envelope stress response protein n=1 Tax=Streptomyces sp. PSKA30 TaxID=2874597 RepID=UPI001CD0F3B9|nr:Asp23/Gls24 family envelope stress response protein [Streptomyces sp. PSKA30]MBZ9638283.1 Asp23/Gls24 family envelope stress response protein [Streptomyces sp. PSKA30]
MIYGDATAVRQAVAEAALAVPGVVSLQPTLASRLAGAAARVWPNATSLSRPGSGVRAEPAPDDSGWHVEVRCVLGEGHRAVDVAREVHDEARSALVVLLAAHGSPESVTVTVTVTNIKM